MNLTWNRMQSEISPLEQKYVFTRPYKLNVKKNHDRKTRNPAEQKSLKHITIFKIPCVSNEDF